MSDARCLNWRLSPQQAPCRRLLTTLILDLEAHLFDTQHDIYMPNCDKRGFFRKKQVSVQGQDYGCSLWHVFLGTCQNRLIFFVFFAWCSAGHLEASDAANAGAWTRMAWWFPPKANRRAAWSAEDHPSVDWDPPLIWVTQQSRSSISGRRRWRSCSTVSRFSLHHFQRQV